MRDPASGELWALRNRCPHHGGPLCLGSVKAREAGGLPGRYELSTQRVLRCPWHGWEFDLKTGQSYFDPQKTRARSYPVEVEKGGVISSVLEEEGDDVKDSMLDELYGSWEKLDYASFHNYLEITIEADDILDLCEDASDLVIAVMKSLGA